MVRRSLAVQGVGTLQIKGHPRIELIRKTCLKSSERRISGLEILQRPGRSPPLERHEVTFKPGDQSEAQTNRLCLTWKEESDE